MAKRTVPAHFNGSRTLALSRSALTCSGCSEAHKGLELVAPSGKQRGTGLTMVTVRRGQARKRVEKTSFV